MTRISPFAALVTAAVALAACAKGETSSTDTANPSAAAPAASAGGEQTPDPGGTVIEVEALTDEQGNNIFRPAEVQAKPGDVVRYKLVTGVHNVHFVADSNPTAKNLPPAGDMMQVPGQTYDLKVTLAPGRYFYQCDPHALLGMVGHLTVAAR